MLKSLMIIYISKIYKNYFSEAGYKFSQKDIENIEKIVNSQEIANKFKFPPNINFEELIKIHKLYRGIKQAFKKSLSRFDESIYIESIKNDLKKLINVEDLLILDNLEDIIRIFILPWYFFFHYTDMVKSCNNFQLPKKENKEKEQKLSQEEKIITLLRTRDNKKLIISKKDKYFFLVERLKKNDIIKLKQDKYIVKEVKNFPKAEKVFTILVITLKNNEHLEKIIENVLLLNDGNAIKNYLYQNYEKYIEGSSDEIRINENSGLDNDQYILYMMANRQGRVYIYSYDDKKRFYILKHERFENLDIKPNNKEDKKILEIMRILTSKVEISSDNLEKILKNY